MTAKKKSLTEFVAEKTKPVCFFCDIPEREDVDSALRAGIIQRLIREWLIEERGYPPAQITQGKFEKHTQARHWEPIK